ncbi:MAG TPA: hypothetical protein VGB55_12855 [Tepidisphaeraceae bacterium]|jgi:cell division protein FtsB
MSTHRLVSALVILQVLTLAFAMSGRSSPASAIAQISDPGAQRERQLEELRLLNVKLERLISELEQGKLQVRLHQAEEK